MKKIFLTLLAAFGLYVFTGGLAIAQAATSARPLDGLVGWWPGNGNAEDVVNHNNGILQGGASFAPGLVGQAFSLDGIDDYIEVPHSPSLDITGAITMEAWFKSNTDRGGLIMQKGDYYGMSNTTSYALHIGGSDEADGKVTIVLYGDSPADYFISADALILPDHCWYHIAATWDGTATHSDNVRLYVNGAFVQSWTKTNPLRSTTESLTIGSMKPPAYFHKTNGLIDEVAIYNRALTAEEIAAIYNAWSAGIFPERLQKLGNVNGDISVDLKDAILALQVLSGLNLPEIRSDYESSGTDVNGDGKIGLQELIYILQYAAGLHPDTAVPSYTSTGTYTYNSGTGQLTLNWVNSDFPCQGPEAGGAEAYTVATLTPTTLAWTSMTWSRPTGAGGNILGTWTSADVVTGNSWTLIFNSDGSVSVAGNIVSCDPPRAMVVNNSGGAIFQVKVGDILFTENLGNCGTGCSTGSFDVAEGANRIVVYPTAISAVPVGSLGPFSQGNSYAVNIRNAGGYCADLWQRLDSSGPFNDDATKVFIRSTCSSVPTGVSAVDSNGQINVSWDSVSGATSYNIYWSTTPGVTKSNGTKMAGATSPHTHANLTKGTTYYYVVTSITGKGESGESGEVHAKAGSSGTWTTKASMPTARWSIGTAVVNNVIYAIGGDNRSYSMGWTAYSTVEAYDPSANTWSAKASMSTARGGVATAVVDGIIYAFGGCCELSTMEAYDPSANTWTTRASMSTLRRELSSAVVNGVIYAIGGWDGHQTLSVVEAYNPTTNAWTTKASMPTARNGFGTAVVSGVVYAIGGLSNSGGPLSVVEAYDPSANTWSAKASMSTARGGVATAVVDGIIYAIGGHVNDFTQLSTVEAYDPATDTWTTKASMPTAREGVSAATLNGTVYAIGGYDGANVLSTVEAYTP